MKHLKTIFACMLMAVLSIGQMWGTTSTLTLSSSNKFGTSSGSTKKSSDNAITWTATTTTGAIQNTYSGTSSGQYDGQQFGTGTTAWTGTFTTSSISSKRITSVAIVANTGGSATLNVSVGSSTYTTANQSVTKKSGQTGNTYTFNGNSTGNITITVSSTSKAFYLKSIAVTYEESSGNNPTVLVDPSSWNFGDVLTTGSASKTFSVSGTNLTSGQNLNITVPTGYSVTPNSITVSSATLSATNVTVSKNTSTAGTYNGNMSISGGGQSSAKTVGLSMTVTAPAHIYQYTHNFAQISDFSTWGTSYSEHTVSYDILKGDGTAGTDGNNDDQVYFKSANHQTGTITDIPVTTGKDVELKLLNNTKYISAVKLVCQQWGAKTQTITLNYSTNGGTTYSTLSPSVTSNNFTIESLSLPAKTNAVKFTFSNASNQVGISSVSFDLVDKVTYKINKSETGCTLSVTNGTSAITSAEAGDEVHVSIASTTEGYEGASFSVKDADNNTVAVSNGKFTMPAKAVTITATANKKQYTVTLSATNGKIQVGGVDKTSISVAHGETTTLTAVPNTDYGFNGWSKSDGANITFDDASANPTTITVTGAGTVTAAFISTALDDPELSWSSNTAIAVKGQAASLPVLTNSHNLDITYTSSNNSVAQIAADGEVTIKGVGETTITASNEEDATYAASSKSYTLTVKGRVTWHVIKDGIDSKTTADYVKDAVPTKPTPSSCDESISLVGWTTSTYAKSDDAPATLYTGNVPAVTDNADYYAVWAVVEEGGWNEITTVANLTAGTYAICSDTYFMKAEKLPSKNRLDNGTATPSISEGKLNVAPAADCQWTISINAAGKYLFSNGDNYAVATTAKNEMKLSSGEGVVDDAHTQWEIVRANNIFEVTNVGRASDSDTPANKYLRNNTSSGWAAYSSTQGDAPRFFKYSAGSASGYTTNCIPPLTVAKPTFSPDGSAAYYTSAQTVTITCTTTGATIYYSLDGSEPATLYTTPITISETKTLKAKAVLNEVSSEIREATYTINLPLTTIQAIIDKAEAVGGTATDVQVSFTNWVVSAISADGKTVYVTDGTKGFAIYDGGASMGFAVLDKLNGTIDCQVKKFSGFAELLGVSASSFGAGLTHDGTLSPKNATIQGLTASDNGVLVTISDVTCDEDKDLLDEDSYYLTPVTWLYANAVTDLESNKIYNVTGVYIYNKNIAPRSAADIVKLSKEQPTITWYEDNTQAVTIGTSYSLDSKDDAFAPVCVANSTGAKSYESSDPEVATIDELGVINVLKDGVTTITCTIDEDDDYVQGSKSFTLKVGVGEATWVATTWASDNSVSANAKMADWSPIAIDANLSMTWSKADGSNDPIYHSDGEGRLYQKNTLTFTASNSKQITRIVFHFSGSNSGTISASEGTYSAGEWTGFAPSVTFTNAPSASGAKIKSIDIEYASGTTTTLEIEDIELSMLSPAAQDIVYTCNKANPVIVYSDYDDEVISIANGKITPLVVGNTTVKASIAAEAPYSSVSKTFNVIVRSGTEVIDEVVLYAEYDGDYYALNNEAGATEIDICGGKVVVSNEATKNAIVWKRTVSDGVATFYNEAVAKYLTTGSSNAMAVGASANWTWNEAGYYSKTLGRTFIYRESASGFKDYSAGNAGTDDYADYTVIYTGEVVVGSVESLRATAVGEFGTYCPKKTVEAFEGATFFTFSFMKFVNGTPFKAYFDEIAEGEVLEAGRPYFYIADAEAIMGVKTGDAVSEGINDNGFIGKVNTFEFRVTDEVGQDNWFSPDRIYVVYQNQIMHCSGGYYRLGAEKAYLDIKDPNMPKRVEDAPELAPGRRRVSINNAEAPQVATVLDELNINAQVMKVIINDKLYIIRGDKMYDTTGRFVGNIQ